jgi:prepilin-type processing-associated H-X9-DG protein
VPVPSWPAYQDWLTDATDWRLKFGSAHALGCNFVFCDGSVHTIGYDINNDVHARLCNRFDGKPIPSKTVD